jgi:glycosyltransferase involved in cell wall biosynthesis
MAQRRRIGLTFSYNEEWIAGTYYTLNIIHALKTLPDAQQPIVVVISFKESEFDIVVKQTSYPHLEFFQLPMKKKPFSAWEKRVNAISQKLSQKKWFQQSYEWAEIDFLYPFQRKNLTKKQLSKVNWVPDFQELHLPQLFSEEKIKKRKKHQKEVICVGDWVVFSSEDSQKDFNTLYPDSPIKKYVLPFAVTLPAFEHLDLENLRDSYDLPNDYYFAPNQFWAHKNHRVLLQAVKAIKEAGGAIHIAFSGKENDQKNGAYVNELKQYVAEHQLEDHISFLGFIPREDQLKLLKGAIAIVQPSKFEGWSTVVEDAKALNQFIILSSLAVHKEQIEVNAHFFDPDDFEGLATILENYSRQKPLVERMDYGVQIHEFALNFMKLVELVINDK